jgi:hypothetical protein
MPPASGTLVSLPGDLRLRTPGTVHGCQIRFKTGSVGSATGFSARAGCHRKIRRYSQFLLRCVI